MVNEKGGEGEAGFGVGAEVGVRLLLGFGGKEWGGGRFGGWLRRLEGWTGRERRGGEEGDGVPEVRSEGVSRLGGGVVGAGKRVAGGTEGEGDVGYGSRIRWEEGGFCGGEEVGGEFGSSSGG